MTVSQDAAIGLDIPLRGQFIEVAPGGYDWIQMWFSGVTGEQPGDEADEVDEVWLHYQDGADPEWLYLAQATRVPVPRHATLMAFRLPERPGVRLSGYRLVAAAEDRVEAAGDLVRVTS
ncbi:hypothetical protein ACFQS1_25230 [Paractinoplanes rhizophilus]|jgi:hypothetical protein|uniref:Uncharacterized protein n=1 Tax=Paractinoplanes rhizophilus TaxID=1416877 RepID=A0ABW2HWP6_9ACTN|nr:hypothetical protein [Actinoplanes sp.]